jgi:hypothetical protein
LSVNTLAYETPIATSPGSNSTPTPSGFVAVRSSIGSIESAVTLTARIPWMKPGLIAKAAN